MGSAANANATWYAALNDTPGRVGPPIEPPPDDIRDYWHAWLERDGFPFWSFWDNIRSWWAIRDLPNVMLVHFSDLKAGMPGMMRRIAGFLDIPIREKRWKAIVEYCSFDWMKRNATQSVPLGSAFWDAGTEVFIHKGVNGRWRDVLSEGPRGFRSERRGDCDHRRGARDRPERVPLVPAGRLLAKGLAALPASERKRYFSDRRRPRRAGKPD